ncbi:E3 ubiquitin-protein ligase rnf168 [Larimichthys crocea]|nr:E3 ubiquitin-protein ligase rnf168 [Larimichthys crocea]
MAPVSDVEVSDRGAAGRTGGVLSLDDCRCPVCLEIFMEPVTLPCTHTFCKDCFLESVDKATLCCPLCRKRVSTWARLNNRNNTMVNQQLWTRIQSTFPLQCQRRLSGQDHANDDDLGATDTSLCYPRVSQPGEVRQEYEDQVTKLTEEKRVLDEEERRASEEYIQRLLAEEEELLQEDRRRREEDERLARQLSTQLNSAIVSQEVVTPAKKKEVSGQIEKFLCPRPSKSSSDCSFTANKENILVSPVKLQAECSPPKLDYYGDTSDPPPPSGEEEEEEEERDLPESHRSHLTGDGGPSLAKRKSSELETTEEEKVTKRACRSLPSSSSSYSSLEGGGSVLQGIVDWESELQSRRQQEEEDRRLALLLQKELDQEEKQRATDRRKGSSDAYLLRQNRRGKEDASSSQTPRRSSTKTTKTSSASSSRGSKQTTLTDMFSCLNS